MTDKDIMRTDYAGPLGFADVDHEREKRLGYPEVIFCEGKTPEQIEAISKHILSSAKAGLLATRADRHAFEAVKRACPEAIYHAVARVAHVKGKALPAPKLHVCVVSAGTADLPVAEEAAVTAEALGLCVDRVFDVGVAGIHRMFGRLDVIRSAGVTIVTAGMDGALASVVGGLVRTPVLAVPTSVGYGASFNGLAALTSMLCSCAPGVAVFNIDNGFGAAYMAARILRLCALDSGEEAT